MSTQQNTKSFDEASQIARKDKIDHVDGPRIELVERELKMVTGGYQTGGSQRS
jgi:hypothetical protein